MTNIFDTSLYFCCSRWRFIYSISSEKLDQIYLVFICKFTLKAVILLCFCQLFCHYVFLSSKSLSIRWYFIFCLRFLYLSVIVWSLSTRSARLYFLCFSHIKTGEGCYNLSNFNSLIIYSLIEFLWKQDRILFSKRIDFRFALIWVW